MDNITLGGPINISATDVTSLIDKSISFGVHLNISKCESITKTASVSVAPLTDFVQLDIRNSTLLGAPLSAGSAMDASLLKRLPEFKRAADCLRLIPAHDSLILLNSPKLTHILRSSPCSNRNILLDIDATLRLYLINISNVNMNDMQ